MIATALLGISGGAPSNGAGNVPTLKKKALGNYQGLSPARAIRRGFFVKRAPNVVKTTIASKN